jgi:hypothetical protein
MWIAGHRHDNAIKAFRPPEGGKPESGFWQVETSSLRDFPQQFRTFEIYLHEDYSVSVVTANVDPAVAEGTPAATSRSYAIATQQICQTNVLPNARNVPAVGPFAAGLEPLAVGTMDPSRPQDGATDPSIRYGTVSGVEYCASYNAELWKPLGPAMIEALQSLFPGSAG